MSWQASGCVPPARSPIKAIFKITFFRQFSLLCVCIHAHVLCSSLLYPSIISSSHPILLPHGDEIDVVGSGDKVSILSTLTPTLYTLPVELPLTLATQRPVCVGMGARTVMHFSVTL